MSYSEGRLKFGSGVVVFFEYDNVSGRISSALWDKKRDMKAHKGNQPKKKCTCGEDSELVELATAYGNGFYWDGIACRNCMATKSRVLPDAHYDGLPRWWNKGDNK